MPIFLPAYDDWPALIVRPQMIAVLTELGTTVGVSSNCKATEEDDGPREKRCKRARHGLGLIECISQFRQFFLSAAVVSTRGS
jgi:hypothetical protein